MLIFEEFGKKNADRWRILHDKVSNTHQACKKYRVNAYKKWQCFLKCKLNVLDTYTFKNKKKWKTSPDFVHPVFLFLKKKSLMGRLKNNKKGKRKSGEVFQFFLFLSRPISLFFSTTNKWGKPNYFFQKFPKVFRVENALVVSTQHWFFQPKKISKHENVPRIFFFLFPYFFCHTSK